MKVQNIVDANKQATEFIQDNPDEAKSVAIYKIKDITDQELSRSVIDNARDRIEFSYEVDEAVLQDFIDSSYDLGFLDEQQDLEGLVDKQCIKE